MFTVEIGGRMPLTIRPASQEEIAEFEAPDLDYNEDPEDDNGEGGLFVTFLLPVDHDHEDVSAIPPQLKVQSH